MAVRSTASRPSQLSEEYIQDSSDEGNDKDDATDSEQGEDSEGIVKDAAAEEPKTNGKTSSLNQGDHSTSDSSSDSEESSNSEDENGGSEGDESAASTSSKKRAIELERSAATPQSSKRQKTSNGATSIRIMGKTFKPPPGFEPLVLYASDYASDAARMFADLAEKQVWHISAPASVNISSIKQFDIETALKGDPIHTENGVNYCMQPATATTDVLLLPQDTTGAYRSAKTKISRGFQLRVVDNDQTRVNADIPLAHASSPQENNIGFTARVSGQYKPPRQQPVGLKPRYTPFGVIQKDGAHDMVAVPPKTNGTVNGQALATNITRTPWKLGENGPAAASDSMDLDENSSTKNGPLETRRKPAEGSPAKSSRTPGEKKRKKKRSKLVDTEGL